MIRGLIDRSAIRDQCQTPTGWVKAAFTTGSPRRLSRKIHVTLWRRVQRTGKTRSLAYHLQPNEVAAMTNRTVAPDLEHTGDGTPASLAWCSSVHASYGTVRALDDASVEVHAGQALAVVGPSGSGKSTLLHCLIGLLVPDGGTVGFEGITLSDQIDRRRSAVRLERMGVVFQFGELLPELTIRENVALPRWLIGDSKSAAASAASELLETFDIEQLGDRHPADVSGGERQRAAVARSLVHEPSVVFADEPTGSLDSANADNVIATLLERTRSKGQALLLVTHEARFAERCDRVVTMRDGRIAEPAPNP